MELELEFFDLLDRLDRLVEQEQRVRRGIEWDESSGRPKFPLYSRKDVHSDLWLRHKPEKNGYAQRNGRRVVSKHVFTRRDAPWWADDGCHYCMCNDTVCHEHEFVLNDRRDINAYVDDAVYHDLWL